MRLLLAAAVLALTVGPRVTAQDPPDAPLPNQAPPGVPVVPNVPPGVPMKTERYLGVFTAAVPAPLSEQLINLLPDGQGLLVTATVPGSPAARAGVAAHDVLVALDDRAVSTPEELHKRLEKTKAGQAVELRIIRRARELTVTVKVAERTVPDMAAIRPPGRVNAEPVPSGLLSLAERLPGILGSVPARLDSRTLVLTQDAAGHFELNCGFEETGGRTDNYRIVGQWEQLKAKLRALPVDLQTDVLQSLVAFREEQDELGGLRVQLQPPLRGTEQSLRVRMIRRDDDDTIRLFELEHVYRPQEPLNVEVLLSRTALKRELSGLPAEVRMKVEQTLRDTRIPPIQLRVERSQ